MSVIKTYSVKEAATFLGVTQRTMYSYLSTGLIKAVKIGRAWRITEEALNSFITRGTKQQQG